MSLKDDQQQNIQLELDFSSALTGEAGEAAGEETESSVATSGTERPASTNRLMEEVCERENLKAALRQVRANQGSPGVDGMTVVGLKDYPKQHWPAIREQLLSGAYKPQPVRRVEIPKPDGGGVRKLGIPRVLDRFIQQAVLQVLQRRWDRTFSDHSYGFRPGRSAHQAVAGVLDQLGAAPTAICPMAAMENRSPSPGGIAGVGGASTTFGQSGWQRPRTLASGAHQSPQRRAFQGIL
jgi:RNA-directed DNA polymerase